MIRNGEELNEETIEGPENVAHLSSMKNTLLQLRRYGLSSMFRSLTGTNNSSICVSYNVSSLSKVKHT